MPKYTVSVTFQSQTVEIDTDDEYFAETFQPQEEGGEPEVDPNDQVAVHDWFTDNAMDLDLIDLSDLDIAEIKVTPKPKK